MGEGPYRRGKEVRVEDKQIIDLYWARAETAISETAKKYNKSTAPPITHATS